MKRILKKIYAKHGTYLSTDASKFHNPSLATYGEFTENGTNSLINEFKNYFNSDTIFYDLGSGMGKMVLHIGMQCGVKKSIGIEFCDKRHQVAVDLQEKYASNYNNIYFYNKDMFKQNISDATVVYVDNTVLNIKENIKIYNKIPSGCLFLTKSTSWSFSHKSQPKFNRIENLVERSYKQSVLNWLIKE